MNTYEVLVKARALIAEGWGKGTERRYPVFDSRTRYCSVGAVKAVSRGARRDEALSLLRRSLTAKWAGAEVVTAVSVAGIVYFNDDPETSHADVLALFDRAIKLVSNGKIASLDLRASAAAKYRREQDEKVVYVPEHWVAERGALERVG